MRLILEQRNDIDKVTRDGKQCYRCLKDIDHNPAIHIKNWSKPIASLSSISALIHGKSTFNNAVDWINNLDEHPDILIQLDQMYPERKIIPMFDNSNDETILTFNFIKKEVI